MKINMLYVLKGDILEYDYQVFGIYSNLNNLLINATKIVKQDISIAENAQEDYDFSGLVYYPLDKTDIDNIPKDDNKFSLYWDGENLNINPD